MDWSPPINSFILFKCQMSPLLTVNQNKIECFLFTIGIFLHNISILYPRSAACERIFFCNLLFITFTRPYLSIHPSLLMQRPLSLAKVTAIRGRSHCILQKRIKDIKLLKICFLRFFYTFSPIYPQFHLTFS